MTDEFPCPTCVVMAVCKARCAYENDHHEFLDGIAVFITTIRAICPMIHDYLHG